MITKRHKVCSSFSRMLGTEQVLNTFCCLPTLPLRYQTSLQFLSILLTFSLLKLYHLLLRILGSHSEVTYFSCIPLSVSILSSSFLSAPKQIISGALSSLLLFFLSVFFFFFFPHKCHVSVIVVITLYCNFFVCPSFYPLDHVISFLLAILSLGQSLAHSRCSVQIHTFHSQSLCLQLMYPSRAFWKNPHCSFSISNSACPE